PRTPSAQRPPPSSRVSSFRSSPPNGGELFSFARRPRIQRPNTNRRAPLPARIASSQQGGARPPDELSARGHNRYGPDRRRLATTGPPLADGRVCREAKRAIRPKIWIRGHAQAQALPRNDARLSSGSTRLLR